MAVRKKGPVKRRKKAVSKKRTNSKKTKRPSVSQEFLKIGVGLAVLVAICLTVAMVADILLKPGRMNQITVPAEEHDDPVEPIKEEIAVAAVRD